MNIELRVWRGFKVNEKLKCRQISSFSSFLHFKRVTQHFGFTALLRSEGHTVEFVKTRDRDDVELVVHGEIIYRCKIQTLQYGRFSPFPTMVSEVLPSDQDIISPSNVYATSSRRSDENKEKDQIRNSKLIQYQILRSDIIGNLW